MQSALVLLSLLKEICIPYLCIAGDNLLGPREGVPGAAPRDQLAGEGAPVGAGQLGAEQEGEFLQMIEQLDLVGGRRRGGACEGRPTVRQKEMSTNREFHYSRNQDTFNENLC